MTRLQRTLRAAIFITLLGVVPAAWFYVFEVRPRDFQAEARLNAQRLFHFDPAKVVSGHLQFEANKLSFSRNPSDPQKRFYITHPVQEFAQQPVLYNIMARMSAITMNPRLTQDAQAKEIQKWGLDSPLIELSLQFDDHTQRTLFIGPHNALVDKHPITDTHKKTVGLAPRHLYEALSKPFSAYRSQQLINFSFEELQAIEVVSHRGHKYKLTRNSPQNAWTLAWTPSLTLAKSRTLGKKSFISVGHKTEISAFPPNIKQSSAASEARIKTFYSAFSKRTPIINFSTDAYVHNHQAKHYGLDGRTTRITFTSKTQSTQIIFGYRLSAQKDGPETVFAHRIGSSSVYSLNPSIKNQLNYLANHFLARTLTQFSAEMVTQVDLHLGHKDVQRLKRHPDDRQWGSIIPSQTKFRTEKIDTLVQAFSQLEANHILHLSPTPQKLRQWNLSPAKKYIKFGTDNKTLGTLIIGKAWNHRYTMVMNAETSQVMLLSKHKLSILPKNSMELRL